MAQVNDADLIMLMQPLGSSRLPDNFEEMFGALRAVMEAIQGLHRLGWCHSDIRWDNIIYQDTTVQNWCLIDCFNVTKPSVVVNTGNLTRKNPRRLVKQRIVSWIDDKRQITDLIRKFPQIGMAARQFFYPIIQQIENDAPFEAIFNTLTALENMPRPVTFYSCCLLPDLHF